MAEKSLENASERQKIPGLFVVGSRGFVHSFELLT